MRGLVAPPQEAGKTRRILVVDDETSIRALCRVNLQIAGMDVLEAADGQAALATVEADPPDLVLLDVMMPGLDGWAVAEALERRSGAGDLPIVFLTARADADDRERGWSLGAVGYVLKPFDPIELPSLLGVLLERIERGERDALRDELRSRT